MSHICQCVEKGMYAHPDRHWANCPLNQRCSFCQQPLLPDRTCHLSRCPRYKPLPLQSDVETPSGDMVGLVKWTPIDRGNSFFESHPLIWKYVVKVIMESRGNTPILIN